MLFELLERWESGDLVVATLMFFFLLVAANSQTNKKSTRERIYAGNGDLVSLNKQIQLHRFASRTNTKYLFHQNIYIVMA